MILSSPRPVVTDARSTASHAEFPPIPPLGRVQLKARDELDRYGECRPARLGHAGKVRELVAGATLELRGLR